MGAKANYTRSAANFHNTNNGLAVFARSGAESFGSPFGSFSIAFRFTRASPHSRSRPEFGPSARRCRTTQAPTATQRLPRSIRVGGLERR
jgi:hypothetical protein